MPQRHVPAVVHRRLRRYYQAAVLRRLGETWHAAAEPAAARTAWMQALDILTQLGHPDADQVRAKLSQLARPRA